MSNPDTTAITIKIRQPAKIATLEPGQRVWSGPIEELEFDLISTQELAAVLESTDDVSQEWIHAVHECDQSDVIARGWATGLHRVISEPELKILMDTDSEHLTTKYDRDLVSEAPLVVDEASGSLISTTSFYRILVKNQCDHSV